MKSELQRIYEVCTQGEETDVTYITAEGSVNKKVMYIPFPLYCWIWEKCQSPQLIERASGPPPRIVVPIITDPEKPALEYHLLPKKA